MTNRAITPSSPAADANPASRWWRSLWRASMRVHARRAAKVALGVLVVGAGASIYFAKVGTKSCDEYGSAEICQLTKWYPFTVQRASQTTSVNGSVTHRRDWHRNGNVWFDGDYDAKTGTRVGKWIENYVDGTPRFEAAYSADVIVGTETWYYPSGKVEWQIDRKDGERDGEERWYHENGELRRVGSYKHGVRDGTFTVFDEEGHIAFKGEYKDGENVSGQRVD
jgi:hypothetical protein